LDALGDLVSARGFALGLLWGGLAVLVSPPLARFARRSLVDTGGLAFACAAFLAMHGWGGRIAAPWSVAFALVLLALGGAGIKQLELRVPARLPRTIVASGLALLPGAIALAIAVPVDRPAWVPWTIMGSTIAVGTLLHDFDRAHSVRAAPFLLLMISVVGAYLTVPSTSQMLVLLGVSVPLALLSFPQPLATFGPAGSTAIAGVYCWIAVVEARTSPGAVVGALGALALLIAEPIGRRFRRTVTSERARRRRRSRSRQFAKRYGEKWWVIVATAGVCQLALALYASRIAGLEGSAFMAILALAPALTVAVFTVAEVIPSKKDTEARRPRSSAALHRSQSRGRHAW
jgi:hypothetical protein